VQLDEPRLPARVDHDAALAEIVKRVKELKIGLPTERATEVSCLSSQAQFDKTMSYIKLGVEGGARIACGGKRITDPALAKGFFVEPTVFADVTDDMRIAREEIFGRWSASCAGATRTTCWRA
jgi:acyl-CoA reductase-like NAD-dependent aldehyde dehydrogenase